MQISGADALVETLLQGGVEVCFANPGTSEMHFVASLDKHMAMRCVLCLFEGGATGAADGYYRMKADISATLLHLASGMGNGYANLHNAKKAGSGIVNIVGNHATYHLRHESPLKGDIAGLSASVCHWTRSSSDSTDVAMDGAAAIRAARSNNGQLATLILPADSAWKGAEGPAKVAPPPPVHRPNKEEIVAAAKILKSPGSALMMGRKVLYGELQLLAGKIAQKTGCSLIAEYLVPRIQRGADSPPITRIPYQVDMAVDQLKEVSDLVLCGSNRPVIFFAYPGKPNVPTSPECKIFELCLPEMDYDWTIRALAEELDAVDIKLENLNPLNVPDIPTGSLNSESMSAALAALMPENSIVVDESITSSAGFSAATTNSPTHDWMHGSGGAIGFCLPAAVGAAVACPDRKVIALTGDGSAMYTVQSLWTMARENLDVTVLVIANRRYQILRREFANVDAGELGRNAVNMLDIDNPNLDWVSISKGHGVEATLVEDVDQLVKAIRTGLNTEGPYLIEVAI